MPTMTAREYALAREKNAAITRSRQLEERLREAERELARLTDMIGALNDLESMQALRDAMNECIQQNYTNERNAGPHGVVYHTDPIGYGLNVLKKSLALRFARLDDVSPE